MPQAIIVGSGPAAVGTALALSARADLRITVIDLGLRLETEHQDVIETLSSLAPEQWPAGLVGRVAAQPVRSSVRGLPEKRAYGSDFPFRDEGQLDNLSTEGDVNRLLVSAAYGGFSTVWGSQVMPFTAATFRSWPVSDVDMKAHYQAILETIPFAGEVDDLADLFPLIAAAKPLPDISARSEKVLAAYSRHRSKLRSFGVLLGRARLAFDSPNCVRCGLCMTGCPFSLIYSAATTMDQLRASGRVTYQGGLMALRVGEEGDRPWVEAKELRGGRLRRFEADRVFLASGAFGTTRLVMGSQDRFDQDMTMQESVQFTLPFVSMRPTVDPRTEQLFTLNQFNMVVRLDEQGRDLSQLHFYTYNPAFSAALPGGLRWQGARFLTTAVLQRLSFAIGYLPSWVSPRLRLRARPSRPGEVTELRVWREDPRWHRNRTLRRVLSRVARASAPLDLWPVLPQLRFAAGGKSYHWGSSFPHGTRASSTSTDTLGRTDRWRRVHLVDASVFPDVPATTFTLTIMANAHRIATGALAEAW